MGLFDFLKSKNDSSFYINEPNLRKHQCDTDKFQLIVNLVKVPSSERDAIWKKSFLESIDTASFSESIPQLKIGTDGFPYFILKTEEKFNPFESYCIRKIKDDILLERGMGVVINPKGENESDWIFTYGDILNYHLNNEFYSEASPVPATSAGELKRSTEVMITQPSESFLPVRVKKLIKLKMFKAGILKPKIMIMSRPANGDTIQEIVFNIFREDFQADEEFKKQIKMIQWYLPKQYIVSSIPKKSELTKQLKLF